MNRDATKLVSDRPESRLLGITVLVNLFAILIFGFAFIAWPAACQFRPGSFLDNLESDEMDAFLHLLRRHSDDGTLAAYVKDAAIDPEFSDELHLLRTASDLKLCELISFYSDSAANPRLGVWLSGANLIQENIQGQRGKSVAQRYSLDSLRSASPFLEEYYKFCKACGSGS